MPTRSTKTADGEAWNCRALPIRITRYNVNGCSPSITSHTCQFQRLQPTRDSGCWEHSASSPLVTTSRRVTGELADAEAWAESVGAVQLVAESLALPLKAGDILPAAEK